MSQLVVLHVPVDGVLDVVPLEVLEVRVLAQTDTLADPPALAIAVPLHDDVLPVALMPRVLYGNPVRPSGERCLKKGGH